MRKYVLIFTADIFLYSSSNISADLRGINKDQTRSPEVRNGNYKFIQKEKHS